MTLKQINMTVMLSAFVGLVAGRAPLRADEGMWLFNNPPRKLLKEKYQFEASPTWLEHVQKASVRFNSGGSGSFVSPDGLIVTNHHIASDCLQKLSTPQRDYLTTGYHARKRGEEVKCLDLELNVLMSIEDVTERIKAAVPSKLAPGEANKARRGIMNQIEEESLKKTGLRSDVVTLYQGGLYHLYRYKKYTDVRLVFAPEKGIAFFGGDPDNFEYPRFDLDVAFFRAYEDGKPAKVEHYLKWSKGGAKNSEMVFISGHPGRTDRQDTYAHLEFLRNLDYPFRLNVIRRREVMLRTYCDRSLENARRAEDELFGYQNSRKARLGVLGGLQDPSLMAVKHTEEKDLRAVVAKEDKLNKRYSGAWDEVAASLKTWKTIYYRHYLLERGAAFNSDLFGIARHLVRLAEERTKPNAARMREYAEAGLASLKQELFSDAPIYGDLEILKLGDSLAMLVEEAGLEHDLARKVLAGKSPQDRATLLVAGTKLRDVTVRKKLFDGGRAAVLKSNDPMIKLALLVDPAARAVRTIYEENVSEPQKQAYAKIAQARFAILGRSIYPDATFTLRLAFGTVKGYEERGDKVAWATTLNGLYKRAADNHYREPFDLPNRWKARKGKLNLKTPFNFVFTADSIGGNSGSPVINRSGEFVGILFDGNIQSLVWDVIYTEDQGRSVAVHSEGILEALRKIYDADELLNELVPKK